MNRTALTNVSALAKLPLADRAAFVRLEGSTALREAIGSLPEPVALAVDDHRLAWALAYNFEHYLAHWSPSASWTEFWQDWGRPRRSRRGQPDPSALATLATSVACENRVDWQPPALLLDPSRAEAAFATVHEGAFTRVADYARAQFGMRAGDPADLAATAWSNAFRDYWSRQAKRRFLAISSIPTLVCSIAFYHACDILRDRVGGRGLPLPEDRGSTTASPFPAALISPRAEGPSVRFAGRQLRERIDACRSRLTPQQKLVSEMAWDLGLRQVEVAERLGISAAAVAQHLDKARRRLRRCLDDREGP